MAEEKRRNQPAGTAGEKQPLRQASPVPEDSADTTLTEPGQQQAEEEYDELSEFDEHTFHHPALYYGQPTIWLPRDKLGISEEAVRNARQRGIDITDSDAKIDDKGKIEIFRDTVPGTDFKQ
jgi:hypothetical protein